MGTELYSVRMYDGTTWVVEAIDRDDAKTKARETWRKYDGGKTFICPEVADVACLGSERWFDPVLDMSSVTSSPIVDTRTFSIDTASDYSPLSVSTSGSDCSPLSAATSDHEEIMKLRAEVDELKKMIVFLMDKAPDEEDEED